jgi:hypothetical protein
MKINECKDARNYAIGFIDPYLVHSVVVQYNPEVTEKALLRYLVKQNTCAEILFPYNFK